MVRRIYFFCWLFGAAFLLVAVQCGNVQLAKGDSYAMQSFNNRAEQFPLEEIYRGQFLDRHGQKLCGETRPALIIFPELLHDGVQFYQRLAQNFPQLSLRPEQIVPTANEGKQTYPPPMAIILPDEATLRALSQYQQPGAVIAPYTMRYADPPLAVHLLGYLDGDGHGVKGLEKRCDDALTGRRATRYLAYLSTARRERLEGLGLRMVSRDDDRKDVVLTLDKTMQQRLEDLLNQHHITKGAAVIVDTATGQIMAAASRPLFDPENVMESYGYSDNQLERVMGDDYRYYPGSIFKVLTALAALEEGSAEATVFVCDNASPADKCPRAHGTLDFAHALKVSCNNYFIALGEALGREKLQTYLIKRAGFALEPNKALDSPSARANGIIGQELFTVSPLEMANLMAAIANDGLAFAVDDPWQAQLLLGVQKNGQWLEQTPALTKERIFSAQSCRLLRTMLTDCAEVDGRRITYFGKTGTPEIYRDGQKQYLSWYIGCAPAEAPRYAVAVVIESIAGVPAEALSGGKYALPFFRALMAEILPPS